MQALPFEAQIHPDARPARRLTWDSREAGPDVAFVALPGERMHGNKFVQSALDAGAPFVLTDLDVPRAVRVADAKEALFSWARYERRKNSWVIGITGSAGKTTAKSYVAEAINAYYMPVYNTMPAIACFLIQYGGSKKPLVVEMGIDRIGEMAELVDLVRPDVGVVTSIGPAHLEQLGSVENIAREKGRILKKIRGLVGSKASRFYPESESYGFGDFTYSGENLQLSPEGARFNFMGVQVNLPHASKVQAEAALLGLILAKEADISLPQATIRMAGVTVPEGRYRVIPGRFTVINDAYNASPLAVQAALEALGQFSGRRISVLGTMLELGPTERQLHTEVGMVARQQADMTFGVGPFAKELGEYAYATVPELKQALMEEIKDGDIILIKASRGISWTPEQREKEGVGLDSLVQQLQHLQDRSPQ